MKTLKKINKKDLQNSHLDTPNSINNIKILLLDNRNDFFNPEVKHLFRIPRENYPQFDEWYNEKLIKEAISTLNNKQFNSSDEYFLPESSNGVTTNNLCLSSPKSSRLVLVASVDDYLAGVSVLKKDQLENKISTFFIERKFENMGLATLLLNTSIEILGTKPIDITVSENNIDKLYPFLSKNGFKKHNEIEGQYNKNKKEFHFKKV